MRSGVRHGRPAIDAQLIEITCPHAGNFGSEVAIAQRLQREHAAAFDIHRDRLMTEGPNHEACADGRWSGTNHGGGHGVSAFE